MSCDTQPWQSKLSIGNHLKPDHSSPAENASHFHTTRWSVVLLSTQSQLPGSKDALAQLCRLYWSPLYAFVRRRGHNPEDAKDLVQGFFLHLLDHKVLAHVDPLKGKFRSFLLASIQNYLSKEGDRSRCLKRGGKMEFVPLDPENAEALYLLEPSNCLTAETIFDARWATTLLDEVMTRLGMEYAAQEKSATFQVLKPFLDPKNAQALPSYEVLASQLQVTLGAVKTLIHRLRKRYTYLLRQEVARTVCDPIEVDEEIHALCNALIAAGGYWKNENTG
jgi:RNA polymerase sigma factor (sigma-70 family)